MVFCPHYHLLTQDFFSYSQKNTQNIFSNSQSKNQDPKNSHGENPSKKKELTYVFVTGGTGGHVFPAIALAQGLKSVGSSVVLIVDQRGEKYLQNYHHLFKDILILKSPKNGSLIQRLKSGLSFMFRDFFRERRLLHEFYKKNTPDIFMAFGGQFTLMPFLIAKEHSWIQENKFSKFYKNPGDFSIKKFFLQQSDGVLGMANKFLLPFADIIFTAFPLGLGPKEIPIGLPIREEFLHMAKTSYPDGENFEKNPITNPPNGLNIHGVHGLSLSEKNLNFHDMPKDFSVKNSQNTWQKPCVLLILGGSQGAAFWSTLLPEVFQNMTSQERSGFFLYHQCPKKYQNDLRRAYNKLNLSYIVEDFFHNMPQLLQKSSLVLCRCGASTLGELCTFSKAALLVPYGQGKNNHQEKNGEFLVSAGGAWMMVEKNLCAEKIKDILIFALKNPQDLQERGKKNHALMKEGGTALFLQYMKALYDNKIWE